MKNKLTIFILIISLCAYAQDRNITKKGSLSFQNHLKGNPDKVSNYAVKGNLKLIQGNSNIYYKYSNKNWHFIRSTSTELATLLSQNVIKQIYFTPSAPRLLNDSMRLKQNIDSVHFGSAPLQFPYTGKNVIMGYVDTGLDYTHQDFKNNDGTSRVLRFWDQNLEIDPLRTPVKYGYGQIWTGQELDQGLYIEPDKSAHGSTVAGSGSGNGTAIGKYAGVAPDCDIIVIKTSFGSENWTMTVADAIDYVFSVADSLGKPAVVNTSVGDYLGSHDGNDPASQIIDSLLKAKTGRIVVAAAGNSGAWDHYHVHGKVNNDTSFTWFEPNTNSYFTDEFPFHDTIVFFDLWVDTADFNSVNFAFGADKSNPIYEFIDRTKFYNIESIINETITDSIMSGSNRISLITFSTEEIDGLYHIEMICGVDSTDYLFRFMTYGVGAYDLWSGKRINLSKIKDDSLPLSSDFPDISHYHMPDSLISTVSSWTCLESVITVGNIANMLDYIDQNGDIYTFNHIPGQLSVNSSKGPNRRGYNKPDISATGDGTLSSCPQYLINSLMNNGASSLDQGLKHVRNGGTSMASPVIAGIAALYLEKCNRGSYLDFKRNLLETAHEDSFTGSTPNFAYGYGKIDAFKLLSKTNHKPTIDGDTLICDDIAYFSTFENNFDRYMWSTGETSPTIELTFDHEAFVITEDSLGCKGYSDSILVIDGDIPVQPIINVIGGGLVTTPSVYHQWYIDGQTIENGIQQFFNPEISGDYHVKVTSKHGCFIESEISYIDISTINELKKNEFIVFPNPFIDEFKIIKNDYYDVNISITNTLGELVYNEVEFNSTSLFISIDLSTVPTGVYFMQLKYNNSYKTIKLVKQ